MTDDDGTTTATLDRTRRLRMSFRDGFIIEVTSTEDRKGRGWHDPVATVEHAFGSVGALRVRAADVPALTAALAKAFEVFEQRSAGRATSFAFGAHVSPEDEIPPRYCSLCGKRLGVHVYAAFERTFGRESAAIPMSNKRHLGEQWDAYARKVMPPNASTIQVQEMRKAFYCGAFALRHVMFANLSEGQETVTALDEDLIRALNDELNAFTAELVALAEAARKGRS